MDGSSFFFVVVVVFFSNSARVGVFEKKAEIER
jgi:hypothetical protein